VSLVSSYKDGVDDPLYRDGGGSEEQTGLQQPYQQQAYQQFQQHPHQYAQQGVASPYGQQGYAQQGQYGAGPAGYAPSYGGPQSHAGYGPWTRPRRQFPIETKPFFLTSEFVGAVLAIVGIAITAAASDAFGAWRAWILITAVLVGYMVARGIAKSGTRSHSSDPRENLDFGNWGRGDHD
jgi:hypothetical protein